MLPSLFRCKTRRTVALVLLLAAVCAIIARMRRSSWPQSSFTGGCRHLAQQLPSVEFYIRLLSTESPFRADAFGPQITATELRATLQLLWAFLDLCEMRGLKAVLYGRSLLGSYRHHGIVPWDDHVHLLMKEADKGRLAEALKGHPDLQIQQSDRWRVSSKSACFQETKLGCWPFVALSFYRLQDGWVVDTSDTSGRSLRYPTARTLPTHKRPFMGRWIDSPRDAFNILTGAAEPVDKCASLRYSHRLEVEVAVEVMDCQKLAPSYPFVSRASGAADHSSCETLTFPDSEPMYTVVVNEPAAELHVE